jgi:hypothetical protein
MLASAIALADPATGAAFDAGRVTFATGVRTVSTSLDAGAYDVRVEYRYGRRALVTFSRDGAIQGEAHGLILGFPEKLGPVGQQPPGQTLWQEVGFGGGTAFRFEEKRDDWRGDLILSLAPIHPVGNGQIWVWFYRADSQGRP